MAADLVADAVRRLGAAAIEPAGREAWWIWERISGQSRASVIVRPMAPVPDAIRDRFAAAVARRAQGEPLAHVLGEAGFRHLAIGSDRRALIPRPETEGLVDLVLACQPTGRVADIGTGTGCVALSLAREGSFQLVVGVERSSEALALARANIGEANGPVALVAGDLCQCLGTGQFDVIVSNPPYLTTAEYQALDGSVKSWEPAMALVSGDDGLDATRQLLAEGWKVVRPGGWIVLEVDCARAASVASLASGLGWSDVLVKDDLFGRARYVVARRSEDRDVG